MRPSDSLILIRNYLRGGRLPGYLDLATIVGPFFKNLYHMGGAGAAARLTKRLASSLETALS